MVVVELTQRKYGSVRKRCENHFKDPPKIIGKEGVREGEGEGSRMASGKLNQKTFK